ncbi:hypothetical protein EYF80_031883 [Liparis tanakae]|uniref:Uncharacterized protein n=1 Tax=Liparis tanakae TaxID=230148 RepID=A0A4Z2GZ58_9TELE|nr:hypothetical protein EYF80_031883 [Liparis tanakae]
MADVKSFSPGLTVLHRLPIQDAGTPSSVKRRVSRSAASHWLLRPRSLCNRLGLSNWVCVGRARLSAPALPPLRFRKQTVSLASAGAAVDPPLPAPPPSSCFLCAASSCRRWPTAAAEQKEEEEANGAAAACPAAACPAFSLLAASQQAAAVPHASVCMQDASLPC